MLFFNPTQQSPDSRHPDDQIDEVLAAFKDAVASGEHKYVTLEWLPETPGRAVTVVKDDAGLNDLAADQALGFGAT